MSDGRTHVHVHTSSVSQPDAPGVSLTRPRLYSLIVPGHDRSANPAGDAVAAPWAGLPRYVCGAPVPEFEQATRPSSRGIVLNPDGTLLLATTEELHEYVFSGGEIEHGETDLEALVREVQEETGWLVDEASACPLLSIDDYHNRADLHLSMRQVNRYFVCRAHPGGIMHLDKYEAVAGLHAVSFGLDEAIAANEAILAHRRYFWVERDTFVLKMLRDRRGEFGL